MFIREGQIPDLLKIADLPKIAHLPEIAGLPKIVALPKIADLPKLASQGRSLFYTFLIEPRFQRKDGKDSERTIRSQET